MSGEIKTIHGSRARRPEEAPLPKSEIPAPLERCCGKAEILARLDTGRTESPFEAQHTICTLSAAHSIYTGGEWTPSDSREPKNNLRTGIDRR